MNRSPFWLVAILVAAALIYSVTVRRNAENTLPWPEGDATSDRPPEVADSATDFHSAAQESSGAAAMPADEPLLFPAVAVKPLESGHNTFATSAACRECHHEEHATWHASYHRTMTQVPSEKSVQAPFNDVTLTDPRGWQYHLFREGDEFWIDTVDLDWIAAHADSPSFGETADPPRARKKIEMVTGSHHKQAFWVSDLTETVLRRIPWSYRIDDQRWIATEYDYLAPPGTKRGSGVWNDNCIRCHSVGGEPRREEAFDTRVAELGIACEACHGEASDHVRFQQQRKTGALAAAFDSSSHPVERDPIINPASCDPKRSTQICGSCHSFSLEKDQQGFLHGGFAYRPGDDLDATRVLVRYDPDPDHPLLQRLVRDDPYALDGGFWRDGTMRVSGRAYNGIVESACYQRGEMTCITCHAMHGYEETDDQLKPHRRGNQACVDCHAEIESNLAAHTHHLPESSGSLCYNCHMPHTTYGLFKAIRSHRIDIPTVSNSVATGRPNACNLCHLDQTMKWAAEHLETWYGLTPPTLSRDETEIAASILWALRGDAVQRAIVAWHYGWSAAKEASGADWMPMVLSTLFLDPYPAVRNVAGRAIRTLPGYERLSYDFTAGVTRQRQMVQEVVRRFTSQPNARRVRPSRLLLDRGQLDMPTVSRLIGERDGRDVFIDE